MKKPKLNIEGASSIVVYDAPTGVIGGRIATEGSNIYKIKLDGSLEQVKFVTEDDQDVDPNVTQTSIQVSNVYSVDENYLVLTGNFAVWDTLGQAVNYQALLVQKSSGAIFDFGSTEIGGYAVDYGEETFRKDGNGNFYYSSQSQVIKVNTTNPTAISRSSYLPSGQQAYYYGIDKDGNCAYQPDQFFSKTRIRKKNGGLYEFEQSSVKTFWASSHGQLYCNGYDGINSVPTISTINVNENDEVIREVVWSAAQFGSNPGVQNLNFQYYHMIKKTNSVIFIAFINGKSFEFFEDDNTVIEFNMPTIEGGKLVHSEKYCYIAVGTKLYRISLTDYSYEDLLAGEQYEVYTINVNASDVLQFSGLRFSDGRKIIAEINEQKEFKVIEEEKDQDVLYLQHLN